MKITIKKPVEVEISTIHVRAKVRNWGNTVVNGVEDTDGTLIPCRDGENWCPVIDIDSGVIKNWTVGITADIHYKVCDCCHYRICEMDGNVVDEDSNYVPDFLCPGDDPDGDYIVMHVDEAGKIRDWDPSGIEDYVYM